MDGKIAAEVAGTIEKLRGLLEKFSKLRDGQVIILEQVEPGVPIEIRKAKVRGHHGIETKGARVIYKPKEKA